MSDSGPADILAEGTMSGFAIGVNLKGYDDTLRLWKVRNGEISAVVNTPVNWQNNVGTDSAVNIVVERYKEGSWIVSVSFPGGQPVCSSSGTDGELFNQDWFCIYYKYSSARDRLLWFDNLRIEGEFREDNEAPVVLSCLPAGRYSVDLAFSEPLALGTQLTGNILDQDGNSPVSVSMLNNTAYRVVFAGAFNNKTSNILLANNICDKYGNCNGNIEIHFTPVWAERGDVIITEIMADPVPGVSLPGREYIEITNRTEFPFDLTGWKLESEEQEFLFPGEILQPYDIRILCSAKDTDLYTSFGKVTGLIQFPSLTDGGKILCLCDSSGFLVHGLEYSSGWYKDEMKSGGGWSLEMIDTRYPFYYNENWSASVSRKGGTPGQVNSVSRSNSDLSFTGILNTFPEDSLHIMLSFSEPVFDLAGNIAQIRINDNGITGIIPTDPLFRKFIIRSAVPLSAGNEYELTVPDFICDNAGNKIGKRRFVFGLPEAPSLHDVLFNELLFNPLPGDPDFIEFYNGSDKIIDASRLQLVSINDVSGDTSHLYPVSGEARCIMPGTLYAITTDRGKVLSRYLYSDPDYLFETSAIPAMSDDKGHLVLFNRELDLIDEVRYNEKMHYSLLSGYEGISLEKTGPANNSWEPSSWHSASESSGWGTPGATNSIFVEVPVSDDRVVLSSSRISPDSDGNEDILTIGFRLSGMGNVISARVYDETGNYIKKLAGNMLMGPEGSLVWDGTADDGTPVRTGIYIIDITLFNDTGKTERWKKVCTVIRR